MELNSINKTGTWSEAADRLNYNFSKTSTEIDKVKAKISEQQARLKELEQKKLEAENSEIVDIVRGMSIPLAELPVVLQQIRAGATLGQNVPKSETEDKEDTE